MAGARERGLRGVSRLGALFFLEADDRLELVDHRFYRPFERFAGLHGAVGLDEDAEAVEIGPVADAHVLHFVVDAAYRTEYRVERDGADLDAVFLVRFLRDVAEALLGPHLKFERRFSCHLRDVALRIQYLHLPRRLEIGGGNGARAFRGERDGLGLVGRDLESDLADVQQNGHDVFLHALDGREFVRNAGDLHVRYRGAGKRGEDNAPQGVAQRVAVAGIEAVYLVRAAVSRLRDDARLGGKGYVIIGHMFMCGPIGN